MKQMMALISVTTVFKVTVALLDKGRYLAAEKLKEGDVTDQQFRSFIVRELDDIRSKLDGMARKDLVASLSFFKEGLVYLYKVLDMKSGEKDSTATVTTQVAVGTKEEEVEFILQSSAACMKTVLTKEMTNFMVQLTEQDISATTTLSDAKERFKDARRKATEAFCNEALNTSDRILAMQYRVMATLLEKVDNPAEALATCRLCLEELHSMPAVQKCFNIQLKQGFKSWFNKTERKEIISSVCRINRVIFDIRRIVGPSKGEEFSIWPCVDIGGEHVDPVCDQRVVGLSHKLEMGQFCEPPWSFGQEGEDDHKLRSPCCIATNSDGQFIVVDQVHRDMKVFDKSGNYLTSSCLPFDGPSKLIVKGIATDQADNTYLLISWYIQRDLNISSLVCVFDKHANLNRKFNLKEGCRGFLITVNNNNVFIVMERSQDMHVYDTNGQFAHSFGKQILKHSCDITAANDGCVMVLEYDYCVHLFSAKGDHLARFVMDKSTCKPHHPRFMAFLRDTGHAVVLSVEYNHFSGVKYPRMLHVYTEHGEFVRSIHLDAESMSVRIDSRGITMTKDGRVTMCVFEQSINKHKVYIL